MVGWLPGQGTHKDLGSLIVAVNDEGGLRHACRVVAGWCPHAQGAAGLAGADRAAGRSDWSRRLGAARWVESRGS